MTSALFDTNCLFFGMTPTNVQSADMPVKRKKVFGKYLKLLLLVRARNYEQQWGIMYKLSAAKQR